MNHANIQSNFLKDKIKSGVGVIGCWSVLPSAETANVLAKAGFDYLIVDMEHGPSSFSEAESIVRACELYGCSPLVRVSHLNSYEILRSLEIGAHGVIVPQIETEFDVARVIEATKYAPIGSRGLSPFTRASGYSPASTSMLTQVANDFVFTGIIVEGLKGISNLESIIAAANGFIDCIYLGPYDLSQSAGYPGQIDHPAVIALVEKSVALIKRSGIAVGTLVSSIQDIARKRELGFQFLAYKSDAAILYEAAESIAGANKASPGLIIE